MYKKYAVFVGEQMAARSRMALTVAGCYFNQDPGCRAGPCLGGVVGQVGCPAILRVGGLVDVRLPSPCTKSMLCLSATG